MTEDTRWVRRTPEQVTRAKTLAAQWRQQAQDDPIVLLNAATKLVINAIAQHVPVEYQQAVIASVSRSLQEVLPE